MNDAIYQRAINSVEFRTARSFCEDGGENEYVRACAEMVCDLTGTPMDYKEAIMAALVAPPKPVVNEADKPESVVALETLVREALAPDMGERTFDVNVYTFGTGDSIRVSEVSYWIPREDNPRLGAGGSWMRSDMQSGQGMTVHVVYVVVEVSTNSPQDDSPSVTGYDPLSEVTVFGDRQAAIDFAQGKVNDAVSDGGGTPKRRDSQNGNVTWELDDGLNAIYWHIIEKVATA